MFGFKASELLIILAVVLVLFGGTRVPQLGSALGQAIRNFKRGFNGEDTHDGSAPPEGKQLSGAAGGSTAARTQAGSSVHKDG